MAKYDLNLLDCTLRDGGYINNWNWGFKKAKIDVVEVGFFKEYR